MGRWLALCSLTWAACTLINDYPDAIGSDEGGGGGGGESLGGGGGTVTAKCDDGYVCVPRASRIVRRGDNDHMGGCGDDWQAPQFYAAPEQPGCLPCSCDPPRTGTCTPGTLSAFTDNDCGSAPVTQSGIGCFSLSMAYGSYILEPSTPSVEACEPQGGGDAPYDPLALCVPADDARPPCEDDGVCVPDGAGTVCALVPGGSSCPEGYGDPMVVVEVLSDDRDCSCSCGPSTGQICQASVTIYQTIGCVGQLSVVADDGNCHNTANSTGSLYKEAGTWSGGSCAPSVPTGELQFGTTETLCCR